jgi:hypothetical protein
MLRRGGGAGHRILRGSPKVIHKPGNKFKTRSARSEFFLSAFQEFVLCAYP